MDKNKEYSSQMGEYAAILVKSLQYKNDIPKFVQYIRDNKKYFPNITEVELDNLLKQ